MLRDQRTDLRAFVRNGSVVLGALNDRRGALRGVIVNSNDTFGALASRDEALATRSRSCRRSCASRARRCGGWSASPATPRRWCAGLQPVADDLAPTVRDLRALAPDLKATFRSLDPLITPLAHGAAGPDPHGERAPGRWSAALNPFLGELNPILAMLQYNQVRLAGFITNGTPGIDGDFGGQRYNNVVGMVDPRSFTSLDRAARPTTAARPTCRRTSPTA